MIKLSEVISTETIKEKRKPCWHDYAFCLIVGSLYLYTLSHTIISSTHIQITNGRLFFIGIISILIFLAILYNTISRIATIIVIILASLFILLTLDIFYEQYSHFYELYLMATGAIHYRADLGITAVWIISLMLAFAMVVFIFHQFNFFVLALGGITIFIFTWLPGFTHNEFTFFLFLFCFCMLLIRKMARSTSTLFITAPLCFLIVFIIQTRMPEESELFAGREARQEGRILVAVNDFIFELFNPMYFTFQSTGFSGSGGRLGGPITLNNRTVMTVRAPGSVYLAGARSNTYTGYSWIPTLQDDDIYTHGLDPGHFEMLETVAALIRNASILTTTHSPNSGAFVAATDSRFSGGAELRAATLHFAAISLEDSWLPFLHTYMPLQTMTIGIGTNRTGTIFTPPLQYYLWFDAESNNYELTTLSIGDVRAPGFMGRGTVYHMRFLDINPQLAFIDEILHMAGEGVYAARQFEIPLLQSVSMGNPNYSLSYVYENGEAIIVGLAARRDMPYSIDGGFRQMLARSHYNVDISDIINLFGLFESSVSPPRRIQYIESQEELFTILNAFSVGILQEYARQVREHFMDVPEIVPQRVWDLTESIVEGLESDFERVMAIRNFLLQFPYTLTPMPVPRGVCFVDHFLFEGQEGYCTYFASAMAIMSRIAGVPSRYVEGFVLPPTHNPHASIVVTNRLAHAWVEVYLEGFGWLTIEATPTYALIMELEAPTPPQIFSPGFDGADRWLADWELDMYNFDWNPFSPREGTNMSTAEDTNTIEATPTLTLQHARWAVVIMLASMIFLAFVFMGQQRWRVRRNLRKMKNLSPNEQVISYFNGILDIVTYYTKPMIPGETPKGYGTHMGGRFAFHSDSVFFRDLINIYYKAKYSASGVTESERAIMEVAYHDMVELLRLRRSRPRFIYLRYIRKIGAL